MESQNSDKKTPQPENDILTVIANIDKLISIYSTDLKNYSNRSYENMFCGINTLLNPVTRNLKVSYNTLMNSTVKLEIKIRSRTILYLAARKRKLEIEAKALDKKA